MGIEKTIEVQIRNVLITIETGEWVQWGFYILSTSHTHLYKRLFFVKGSNSRAFISTTSSNNICKHVCETETREYPKCWQYFLS